MSRPHRRLLALVGIILAGTASVVGLSAVRGQPGLPPLPPQPPGSQAGPNGSSYPIEIPTSSRHKKTIEAIQDFISDSNWEAASKYLQDLLDQEDVFIQVTRKGPDGRDTMSWISVRKEAERLLANMAKEHPKGLEHYQMKSGHLAKELLDKAKETSDPTLLAQVEQRFLYTEAGAEATNLLGTYYLDRASYVTAALRFERLLQREREKPDGIAPVTLFKAALAFHLAGDKTNEEQAWKQLAARARTACTWAAARSASPTSGISPRVKPHSRHSRATTGRCTAAIRAGRPRAATAALLSSKRNGSRRPSMMRKPAASS